MTDKTESLTIGVEEEYFLVDCETGECVVNPPDKLIAELNEVLKEQVSAEAMRSQIEVKTTVCHDVDDLREQLIYLRKTISEVALPYRIAPIAVSTHPSSSWHGQEYTCEGNYLRFARDYQRCEKRSFVTGMHIHVGIPSQDERIDVMNKIKVYLPYFIALTASSPFWCGHDTGLASYRTNVWDSLPRTGIPQHFGDFKDYQKHVDLLVSTGVIEGGGEMWWDIRPNSAVPTLELRVSDVCTHVEDAVSVAALFFSLARHLLENKEGMNAADVSPMIMNENRWRAQRYGIKSGPIDPSQAVTVPYSDCLEGLLALLEGDAKALHCKKEMLSLRGIVKQGTSADRQRKIYYNAIDQGSNERDALKEMISVLIGDTVNFSRKASVV